MRIFRDSLALVAACAIGACGGTSGTAPGADGGPPVVDGSSGAPGSGSLDGSAPSAGDGGTTQPGSGGGGSGPSGEGGAGGDASTDEGGGGGTAGGDAGPCGVCPPGFSCSASGTYCIDSHGVPAFDHVFIIVMENTSQADVQGNQDAPYINQLLGQYAYTTNYSTNYHPSLPNYLDIISGTDQNVSCDCQPTGMPCDSTCGGGSGQCNCGGLMGQHLGDQLDGAHVRWRQYAESMGSPCASDAQPPFAAKHVPFLYFQDVLSNAGRCQESVRDYGDLAADLASGTYRFSFISPNLCHDMHGGSGSNCPGSPSEIAQGDTWLKTEVPKILATPGFGAGGKDVLFLVWDEQTGSAGGASTPMLGIIISPLAKPGPTHAAYTHESLLATIEDSFGVPPLNGAASAPSPINDIWK